MGIKTVPSQYIQPLEERLDTSKTEVEASIPVIDFSKWDDPNVADAIFEAATKYGFFQIVNHGVPNKVVADLEAAVHRFFDLPTEEKREYARDSPSESVRYGTSFSPRAEQVLEWKDYFIMLYVSEDQAFASWPPECREEAIEYMKQAEDVIKKLLHVLLKRLNVKDVDKETEHMLRVLRGLASITIQSVPTQSSQQELAATRTYQP
ncbi:hypothetical protein L484_004728 [Morus notabilis]|uniref:Non-haem dioxygenase N-terminal domain-containing protein n=1 Tax=Morus notabilis TaxID=981085 RepID=W9S1V5_9ROSA|nr:hypothetical protein L484_004728 [Morus notabilis]